MNFECIQPNIQASTLKTIMNVFDLPFDLLGQLVQENHTIRRCCKTLCQIYDEFNTSLHLTCPDLHMIQKTPNLKKLIINGISDIKCKQIIQKIKNIEQLKDLKIIPSNFAISKTINYISICTSLENIDISYSLVSDLDAIGNCLQLQSLILNGCLNIENISPLQNCVKLKKLSLVECYSVTDITPLSKLTNLKDLNIRDCIYITNTDPLGFCTGLESLSYPFLNNIDCIQTCMQLKHLTICEHRGNFTFEKCNIDAASNLKSLESLDIEGYFNVSDISSLSNCCNLKILDISACDMIDDISVLKKCTLLEILYLGNCVNMDNVSVISNFTRLKHLELVLCNLINDLSFLKDCTLLTILNLSYNKRLSDLSVLKNLTALEHLNLSYCYKISDLSVLSNFTRLKTLYLTYCRGIYDLSPLKNCPSLKYLDLQFISMFRNINLGLNEKIEIMT